jgi:hypothetical protein
VLELRELSLWLKKDIHHRVHRLTQSTIDLISVLELRELSLWLKKDIHHRVHRLTQSTIDLISVLELRELSLWLKKGYSPQSTQINTEYNRFDLCG